jgi:hypothetical protein
MSEILENVLTTSVLRMAIRNSIAMGVSRRTISLLIYAYATRDPAEPREAEGVPRRAVEYIPHDRRASFLEQLAKLSPETNTGPIEIARLVS